MDGVGDGAGHLQVEALLGAVGVHGGQQNLPCPQGFPLLCPLDGVQAGGRPATGHHHFIAAVLPASGVDGQHHALAAEPLRRPGDEGGVLHRRRVDADLIGARPQQLLKVLQGADAAAYGDRHEHLLDSLAHHVGHGLAGFVGGGDVQEDDLVCALLGVVGGQLHRVTGVADVDKVHALDHPSIPDVQARDNAFG